MHAHLGLPLVVVLAEHSHRCAARERRAVRRREVLLELRNGQSMRACQVATAPVRRHPDQHHQQANDQTRHYRLRLKNYQIFASFLVCKCNTISVRNTEWRSVEQPLGVRRLRDPVACHDGGSLVCGYGLGDVGVPLRHIQARHNHMRDSRLHRQV